MDGGEKGDEGGEKGVWRERWWVWGGAGLWGWDVVNGLG